MRLAICQALGLRCFGLFNGAHAAAVLDLGEVFGFSLLEFGTPYESDLMQEDADTRQSAERIRQTLDAVGSHNHAYFWLYKQKRKPVSGITVFDNHEVRYPTPIDGHPSIPAKPAEGSFVLMSPPDAYESLRAISLLEAIYYRQTMFSADFGTEISELLKPLTPNLPH